MTRTMRWTEQIDIPYEDLPPWCLEGPDGEVAVDSMGHGPKPSAESLLDRLIGSDKAVITLAECATVLGISTSAARRAEARGHIPSIKMNRKILVPTVALRRLLGERDVTGDGDDGATLLSSPYRCNT